MEQLLRDVGIGEDKTTQELFISYDVAEKIKNRLSEGRYNADLDLIAAARWIAEQLRQLLPNSVVDVLETLGSQDRFTCLTIRGLPTEKQLPATPYLDYLTPDNIPLVSALNIGIYQLANIAPVAYQNENKGRLLRHVVPAKHGRKEKSSQGSLRKFGLHVDNPDLALTPECVGDISACPEFLSLMAIRSDVRVRSSIVQLDDVLENLSVGTIEQLSEPNFELARPDSFNHAKKTRLPLIVFNRDGVAFTRYDKENATPLTPKAAAALLMYEAQLALPSNHINTLFLPGDFLLFRNQRVMHARSGFEPRDDGADRWLVRLFGMSSPCRIKSINDQQRHIGLD